ncbi:MAG: Hpt domain-containing protein [Phycisphaerales bacterium]|nr:Hpt domain-containing protein [Phycisphaerales bacterium]
MKNDPIYSAYADDEEMLELVEMFVGEMPERITALNTAWQGNAREQVQRIAHQLKGASAGYGFAAVGRSAADLEAALKDVDRELTSVKAEFEALVNLCQRVAL